MLGCVLNVCNLLKEASWIFKSKMAHWQIVWASLSQRTNYSNWLEMNWIQKLSNFKKCFLLPRNCYYWYAFCQQLFFREYLYTRSTLLYTFFFSFLNYIIWYFGKLNWVVGNKVLLFLYYNNVTYLCLNVSCHFRQS